MAFQKIDSKEIKEQENVNFCIIVIDRIEIRIGKRTCGTWLRKGETM